MRKLRLIVTLKCGRKCEKCCNKTLDLDSIPNVRGFGEFDEIIITGGEPLLLAHDTLRDLIYNARSIKEDTKIYIQTALPYTAMFILQLFDRIDGVTITLHDQRAVATLAEALEDYREIPHIFTKSIRVNVLRGVDISSVLPVLNARKIPVKEFEFEDNCPLPEGEVLMKKILL